MSWLPAKSLVVFSLLAFSATQSSGAETPPADQPVAVTSSLEAVLPTTLQPLLLDNATVTFFVTVDETGALVDYLALEATHHGLLEPAEALVQKSRFRPATAGGQPVQASLNLTVTFYDPSQRAARSGVMAMPFASSPGDAVQRRIYENTRDRFVYRRAEPKELDQPLTMTAAKLIVLTDATGAPARGNCLVEFYVDRLGQARAPSIVKADNDTVALSALLSVREARFEPPKRQGAPTYVKVRQPINYAPDPIAAAAP